VEASVLLTRPDRPEPFRLFVLKALALAPGSTLGQVDRSLHLGRQILHQILHRFQAEGLAQSDPTGRWDLTPLGRLALDRGEFPRAYQERRTFHFLESDRPGQPPHFVNLLTTRACIPWKATDDWGFDAGSLEQCLHQQADWKRRHGFPPDVQQVVRIGRHEGAPGEAGGDPEGAGSDAAGRPPLLPVNSSAPSPPGLTLAPPWQQVMLDRPEHLVAALILAPQGDGTDSLLGFAVHPEGWVLEADEPVFRVGAGWQEVFPELAEEPAPDCWRQAWRTWCQPRGIPLSESDACALEWHAEYLQVVAPPAVLQRLRTARSEALKGLTWVLAGTGRFRSAALVRIVSNE
jgi:hypothetical protein